LETRRVPVAMKATVLGGNEIVTVREANARGQSMGRRLLREAPTAVRVAPGGIVISSQPLMEEQAEVPKYRQPDAPKPTVFRCAKCRKLITFKDGFHIVMKGQCTYHTRCAPNDTKA
jgi:hypothetical protein